MKKFLIYLRLGPYIIFCFFNWILKYSNHPEKYPLEVRYAKFKKFAAYAMKIMKPSLVTHGLEYMVKHEKPFVGVANHRYFMDPFFYAYLSDKPVSFIAKKEVAKIPFVGRVFRAIDGYFIDRENIMGQVRLFKTIAERMKKGDISYFIFPEGTRMKDHSRLQTLPYKDGSIKLAYWAGVDILYSVHLGTENVLKKPMKGHKKSNITIEFFPPLQYENFKDTPTTQVMPQIEKESNEAILRLDIENKNRVE